jgi:hypothetical protein
VNPPFQFTPLATEDLDAIWWFIAEDSRDAAESGRQPGFYDRPRLRGDVWWLVCRRAYDAGLNGDLLSHFPPDGNY